MTEPGGVVIAGTRTLAFSKRQHKVEYKPLGQEAHPYEICLGFVCLFVVYVCCSLTRQLLEGF